MSDEDDSDFRDDMEIFAIRRVHCPQCGKFRAIETYLATPEKPDGEISLFVNCEDPGTDDEVWERFSIAVSDMADNREKRIMLNQLLKEGKWVRKLLH